MFKSIKENRDRLLVQRKKGVRSSVFDATGAHRRTPMPTISLTPATIPVHASDAETPNALKAAGLNTGSVGTCDCAVFGRTRPPCAAFCSAKVKKHKNSDTECGVVSRKVKPQKKFEFDDEGYLKVSGPKLRHHIEQGTIALSNYWYQFDDSVVMFDTIAVSRWVEQFRCAFVRHPDTNKRRLPHELNGYYGGGPMRQDGDYTFYPSRRYPHPPRLLKRERLVYAHAKKDHSLYELQSDNEPHDSDPVLNDQPSGNRMSGDDSMALVRLATRQFDSISRSGLVPTEHVKLIEDLAIFSYSAYRSRSFLDFVVALTVLFKLRTSESVIEHLIVIISGVCKVSQQSSDYDIQSNDKFTWFMDALRSDTYKEIVRILTILCGLFMMFGNNHFPLDIFEKCERSFKFNPVISGTGIFLDIVSTLSNIYSKMLAFIESGDVNDFVDAGSNIRDFCDRVYNVERVSRNFQTMTSMFNCDGVAWSFHAYALELNQLMERAPHVQAVVRSSPNSIKDKIRQRVQSLKEVRESFMIFIDSQKFKRAPFSLLVYGETSIGKSSIVRLIQELHAKITGLPSGQEYSYTVNPQDKYMSGFSMHHHTLVLDDIATLSSKKASDGDPQLNYLMRIMNNVSYVAPQADVESKGKVPVKVELIVGTTNVKSLDAHAYFNVPSAPLRRFPYVVSPSVKPSFARLDENGMPGAQLAAERTDGSNDYYLWTVEEVIPVGKNVKYSKVLDNVTLTEFIRWLDTNVHRHRDIQDKVMAASNDFCDIPMCDDCKKIRSICVCTCPACGEDKPQCVCYAQQAADYDDDVPQGRPLATGELAKFFFNFALIGYIWAVMVFLIMWICERIVRSVAFFRTCCRLVQAVDDIHNAVIGRYLHFRLSMMDRRKRIGSFIADRCGWRRWSTRSTCAIPIVLSMISAGTFCYFVYTRSRKFEQQGNIASEPQMFAPDGEDDRKNWYTSSLPKPGFFVKMTPGSRATSQCNVNDVKNKIKGNIQHVTVVSDAKTSKANAVFIKGNYLVLNNHTLYADDCTIKFNSKPKGINTLGEVKVNADMIHRIPELDLCVVRLSKLPMMPDISQFLLAEFPDPAYIFSGEMLRKPQPTDADCESTEIQSYKITSANFGGTPGVDRHGNPLIKQGFLCKLDKAPEKGYCGSVTLFNMDSSGNGLIIAGLHHAASNYNGITTPLTRSVFNAAVEALEQKAMKYLKPGEWSLNSMVFSTVDHSVCRLGSDSRDVHLKPMHPKCPLRWIQEGVFTPIGSHDGIRDSNLRSHVTDFPLRAEFEAFGYTSEKVAPRLDGWEIHRKALLETVSCNTMDEDILNYVTAAYISDVLKRVPEKEFRYLKPLDAYSSVNGVANFSYIDSIVMSTSAGWPYSQKKAAYFQMCTPREGHQFAYEPIPELQQRIDDIQASYDEGKRIFPIWKTFTKDEPISKAKYDEHRTRHLFCSPVDFSIIVRKYTLTLARMMQRNQFAFETAMGIVAQSSEWTELYRYLTRHPNNIFGDYVSYDKTMNLSVMRSVFLIIKVLCQHSGNYTEQDIKIISCIEEDTACPLVDFFGDLIMFNGINPSGSPLTTMINCLGNCLYMRYAFVVCANNVSLPRELVFSFRKYVNLITYGDDNGMAVSDEIPWFTHKNLKHALKSVGVGYTTPDKDKEGEVDYLDISTVDFLSRAFVYDEEVGGCLAPLSKKSMGKMVCHYMKSRQIPEINQVLQSIDAFVSESFYHGREVYERNRDFCQLLIQEKYGLRQDYLTWEEQVNKWHERSKKFARIHDYEA
nr:hypothetical protein [Beihai razor shell virus 1]